MGFIHNLTYCTIDRNVVNISLLVCFCLCRSLPVDDK